MNPHCPPFLGFDIETRPEPSLVDRFTKPFPAFNEADVKCGNLKDPVKIAARLAEAKDQHADDEVAYWKKAHENAALSPFTGSIVVIGLIDEEGNTVFIEGDERTILAAFWARFNDPQHTGRKFVFWSGCGASEKMFDLDFIVTRSRIQGVRVPPQVRQGRYYSSRFIDLASEFLLHQREAYLSLTKAADMLGLYGADKPHNGLAGRHQIVPKREDDPVTGENFHQWYDGKAADLVSPEEQRRYALKYLANDLSHLLHLAPRIL